MASTAAISAEDHQPAADDLSAPLGWKKTIMHKKSGAPGRGAVVFVSPTGEEIKSKSQLDRYLKSHPGGPSSSEFDWSTGETPRRSRRISEKFKVTESPPEGESTKKRRNKSASKEAVDDEDEEAVEEEEAAEEKGEAVVDDEGAAEEKEDVVVDEEAKVSVEIEMKEAEPGADKTVDQETDKLDGGENEETEEKKESEGTSKVETEKTDEKIASTTTHDEDSKARDESKEEKKPADEPKGELPNDIYPTTTGLEEKKVHEPKASEISC